MTLRLTYDVEENDHGRVLRSFLKKQQLSRRSLTCLKHRGGLITVNGESRKVHHILNVGDVVEVVFPAEPVSKQLAAIPVAFEIVYEDDYLLVVNKQEGLPVLPTGTHEASLINGILAHYNDIQLESTVHVVNRLDKDTSGLMVVAKYRHIHYLMTKNMEKIGRQYYALVQGRLEGAGEIEAPIFRSSPDSIKRTIDFRGKRALTDYESVRTYGDKTLVRCKLKTGRTHQIRVHLAHLGYPIIGDPLYGRDEVKGGQRLHSYHLEFEHPISKEIMTFERSIPERFDCI